MKSSKRTDIRDERVKKAVDRYYAAFQLLVDALLNRDDSGGVMSFLGELNIIVTTAMHSCIVKSFDALKKAVADE